MKKLLLILCAVSMISLVGCNQGGTSDQSNTGAGNGGNTMSNAPSTSPSPAPPNASKSTNNP